MNRNICYKCKSEGVSREGDNGEGRNNQGYTSGDHGSGLGKPEPGYIFEKVTISGGKYVTAAAAVALGIKYKPLRLTSADGYGRQLRAIADKNILFYDSGDRRGWLVNGASALLQVVPHRNFHMSVFHFRRWA